MKFGISLDLTIESVPGFVELSEPHEFSIINGAKIRITFFLSHMYYFKMVNKSIRRKHTVIITKKVIKY